MTSQTHDRGGRSLTPLITVTGAALLFTVLLVLVRLQWVPLESVDRQPHLRRALADRYLPADQAERGWLTAAAPCACG